MNKIRIVIPEIPPSNNKFAGRKNEWQYRKEKKEWTEKVAFYAPKVKEPFQVAIVTLRYYFKTKNRRDPDNYSGKFILDGLTAAGIIKDDSFDCIKLNIEGLHDKNFPRTEIIIEEDTQRPLQLTIGD